jgi:hypothetical protein
MTKDEINHIADTSFLTHDPRCKVFKIHTKPTPDGTKYTDYVEFILYWNETPWDLLLKAGVYEVVVLEWIINVHELDAAKRRAKWELEKISSTTVDW